MGDQQHADPLALDECRDFLNDARAHDGVERGERLVHQEQLRRHRQHLRERDALALAAAQMTREAMPEAGKTQPLEPDVSLLLRPGPFDAVEDETERDILARGLPRQQGVVLKQDADLGWRKPGLDRSRERFLEANHRAQQARLA